MTKKQLSIILTLFVFCLVGAGLLYFFAWQSAEKVQISLDFEQQSLIILNPTSHPQAGDNWTVSFETKGTADLTITPDDQQSIDDLDFVSLKCLPAEASAEEGGGEERTPQILENDVILYPNWQCDGTGEINHLVNVAEKHTLKFQFGDQIAYAYNNPDESTYNFVGVTSPSSGHIAYEKYGSASFDGPDDTGNGEATQSDYDNIESSNDVRWTTDGADTDGYYDSQLYKFYIDEDESSVTQLDFTWEGYGETESGYNTTFYAWDYDGSAWVQLAQVDFTETTDQNLTHSETTDPGKFIDTDGEVTLMVKTKKYVWSLNETTCNALSGWKWIDANDGGSCWSKTLADYVSWNKGVGNDTDNPGAFTCATGYTLKQRMEAAAAGEWYKIVSSVAGTTITSSLNGSAGYAYISALAIADCVDGTRDLCSTDGCLGNSWSTINSSLRAWASASGKSALPRLTTDDGTTQATNDYRDACVDLGPGNDVHCTGSNDFYLNRKVCNDGDSNSSWAAACGTAYGNNWNDCARSLGHNSCEYNGATFTSFAYSGNSFRVVVRP